MKLALFDLNGVFIQSPYLSNRFKQDYGIENAVFLPVLNSIMDIVRKPGAKDVYSYFQPYLREWNVLLSQEEFYAYWFGAEKPYDEMLAVASELKQQGWKLAILSNNFRERSKYYATAFPFLDELFDTVYYSWETGFVKPDARCFEKVLTDFAVMPIDCYFFDDSAKNVSVAAQLGMHAEVFRNAAQVRELLTLSPV